VLDEDVAAMVRGLATTLIGYIETNTCAHRALENMVRKTPVLPSN